MLVSHNFAPRDRANQTHFKISVIIEMSRRGSVCFDSLRMKMKPRYKIQRKDVCLSMYLGNELTLTYIT